MKRLYLIAVLSCAVLAGCDSHKDLPQLEAIQPPQFKDADLNWPKGTVVKYEIEMTAEGVSGKLIYKGTPSPDLLPGFMKMRRKPIMPPFYKGASLHYVQIETPGRGYAYRNYFTLAYEFPKFTTEFLINNGIVGGARTKSKDGKLRAEASVHYFVKELPDGTAEQGIKIREYHYDNANQIIFTCSSEIDSHTGFKISESELLGKKQNEYYFIWPAR